MKLFLLLLFSLILIQSAFSCIFIKLNKGIIKGRLAKTPEHGTIFYAFQEIPYAAPPVGDLRFQPPQEVPKWKGILDTTRNTKICYQTGPNSDKETEDCLYLNVYTPKLASMNGNLLPVMVYIHGGGFILGDSTHKSYGPEYFMDHGVVIVTFNYRLGPFGFLSTQDEVIPGNIGLKDQLFALQWVNKNIHLFGGDSAQVTIFGQSAGAASVGYHLISEKSKELFRAAIMESGSPLCPFSYQRNARSYAFKTGSLIDSTLTQSNTSQELLTVTMKASASEIDEASGNITAQESYDNIQMLQGYYYAPVVEKESTNAFLTEKMFEIINHGNASTVPVIMGMNSEEMIGPTTDLNLVKRIMSQYDLHLNLLVPNDMNIESEEIKIEAGRNIRTLYSKNGTMENNSGGSIRYMSDTGFSRPIIKHASVQSQYSNIYFYQFSYDGKMGNVSTVVEGTERVGHNEENPYFWRIQSSLFDNYNMNIFPDLDVIIHNRLLTLWTNFAKTLNPTPKKDYLLQHITWPKVTNTSDFSYLNIGENLEIKSNPKADIYKGWIDIYDNYGKGPYDTY